MSPSPVRSLAILAFIFSLLHGLLSAAELRQFDIPAGPAEKTIKEFITQSGADVIYAVDVVRGVSTGAVHGKATPQAALVTMLADTPLVASTDASEMSFTISRRPVSALTGSIEGRVFDSSVGRNIGGARVTVEGLRSDVFTDLGGQFRLSNLRAGLVKLTASYAAMEPVVREVMVKAGETTSIEIDVAPKTAASGDGKALVLDTFVVAARKETDASIIAINEQRIAPNVVYVVATDEFGSDPEGNVGEFLKFLPGMTIEYAGGNARSASISGVPAAYVPVTINNFDLASTSGPGGTGREVALDFIGINNMSRMELQYSPTPDTQGGALAGAINMIPRSGFEQVRPVFEFRTFLTMRDNEADFKKSPGPFRENTVKVKPGGEFYYAMPVSKTFAFTVSGSAMQQFAPEDILTNTWRGVSVGTNGAAFPNTTPDKPYLTSHQYTDSGKETTRYSMGTTLDFHFKNHHQLSFGFIDSSTKIDFLNRNMVFNITRVASFTPTSTQSTNGGGNVQVNANGRLRDVRTNMPYVVWRYSKDDWKLEGGAGYSRSSNLFRDMQVGRFMNPIARVNNVTIAFNDFSADTYRPASITVMDATNTTPVDPYTLGKYSLVSANTNEALTVDQKLTAYLNAQRAFYGSIPVKLKAGLELRKAIRDTVGDNATFNYVGADGKANTADDSAVPFLDAINAVSPVRLGHQFETVDDWRLYAHYQANPAYFTTDANAAYTNMVNLSMRAEETVSAAYLRADVALFHDRLTLVGGVRGERTDIEGLGPLTDPTRNFQRDANGNTILGSNGSPLLIQPAGSLAALQLTSVVRGSKTEKSYDKLFPSLNATLKVTESLLLRAAVFNSIGRPAYDQYAGGLLLPNTEQPPASNNVITIANSGINPWSATSVTARLEYYFKGGGAVSFGVFRRDYKDFFGQILQPATPELLALYGLDPEVYGPYSVSTQYNVAGKVRMEGYQVSYKQPLTFLPAWAKGIQVFGNFSHQTNSGGAETSNFSGFVPNSASWGFSFNRKRYLWRMNWNYRGRSQGDIIAAATSIDPATYNYTPTRRTFDLTLEYRFRKGLSFFATCRNVTDEPNSLQISGPTTPAYAAFRRSNGYGALWTFGIHGEY